MLFWELHITDEVCCRRPRTATVHAQPADHYIPANRVIW